MDLDVILIVILIRILIFDRVFEQPETWVTNITGDIGDTFVMLCAHPLNETLLLFKLKILITITSMIPTMSKIRLMTMV